MELVVFGFALPQSITDGEQPVRDGFPRPGYCDLGRHAGARTYESFPGRRVCIVCISDTWKAKQIRWMRKAVRSPIERGGALPQPMREAIASDESEREFNYRYWDPKFR